VEPSYGLPLGVQHEPSALWVVTGVEALKSLILHYASVRSVALGQDSAVDDAAGGRTAHPQAHAQSLGRSAM
jgi:hypothetical protein